MSWDGIIKQGQDNNSAKLSESDVHSIRGLVSTMSDASIAKHFGVSKTTIKRIRRGTTWKGLV